MHTRVSFSLHRIFFHGSEFDSRKEFEESIRDIPYLLEQANKPRGSIPEESIYLALVTRLFSEYRLDLGKYDVSYNLKNYSFEVETK